MNARFWVYHNGWVKLTLKPGQKLNHTFSCLTDEGYVTQAETYSHDGTYVYSDMFETGRDCDGPYSRSTMVRCHISSLKDNPSEDIFGEIAPDRPFWERVDSWQRDIFAEEMGY